ncbi:expressed unknown protein [Seminavis robusta]|uniref:DUF6824 domain-containing protein n=1 Tax=Seminavis robusta TaxID=568900 RepID=A0A9N8H6M8_9STRA|nr:expressed unknown protein [Seminavis robusta]|eukprot:Sro47_g028030.1 n/a (447) ;mRNA; r:148671-150011
MTQAHGTWRRAAASPEPPTRKAPKRTESSGILHRPSPQDTKRQLQRSEAQGIMHRATATKSTMDIKTDPFDKDTHLAGRPAADVTAISKRETKPSVVLSSHLAPPPAVIEDNQLRDADVVFGRGGMSNHIKGNWLFRIHLDKHKGSYQAATDRKEKRTLVKQIIEDLRTRDFRFLELKDGKWAELSERRIHYKVTQRLRERSHFQPIPVEAAPLVVTQQSSTEEEIALNDATPLALNLEGASFQIHALKEDVFPDSINDLTKPSTQDADYAMDSLKIGDEQSLQGGNYAQQLDGVMPLPLDINQPPSTIAAQQENDFSDLFAAIASPQEEVNTALNASANQNSNANSAATHPLDYSHKVDAVSDMASLTSRDETLLFGWESHCATDNFFFWDGLLPMDPMPTTFPYWESTGTSIPGAGSGPSSTARSLASTGRPRSCENIVWGRNV